MEGFGLLSVAYVQDFVCYNIGFVGEGKGRSLDI